MQKDLVKLANHLDSLGHKDLSDRLDLVLTKLSQAVAETDESLGETTFVSVKLDYPEDDARAIIEANPNQMAYAVLSQLMEGSLNAISSGDERLDLTGELIDWAAAEGHDLTGGAGKDGYIAHMRQQMESDPAWGVTFEEQAQTRRAPSLRDLSDGLITDDASGNEFRQWANEHHNAKTTYDLDPQGSWNNSYMRRAWADLGTQYAAYKAGETSGTQAAPQEKEWEEGQTHKTNPDNQRSIDQPVLNLEDEGVNRDTVRISNRLKRAIENEGQAFFGSRRLRRRQQWAVRQLMRQHEGMTQLQAAAIVDEMLTRLRAEVTSESASEANDSIILDSEAASREERMTKAANLLGREFTFSKSSLVRR